jgi:hypothetical protein
MRRRWLWPTCLTALLAAALLRGTGIWPARPAHAAPPAEESEPPMSSAEYRYLFSQPSHWRACMLKH